MPHKSRDNSKQTHRENSLQFNPLEAYPEVLWHAEEPKINLLQGFNMSQFVQPFVKVVLGGLGGDELFAGYDIHRFIHPFNNWHRHIPKGLAKLLQWKSDFIYRIQRSWGRLSTDEYRRGIQMLMAIGDIEKYYLILRNVWDMDRNSWREIYAPAYLKQVSEIGQTRGAFDHYFSRQQNGETPS